MAPSHLDFCKRGLDPLGAAAGTGRDQDVPRRGVGATVASRRGRAPGGGRAGCPRPPEPRPPAGQLVGASGGRHGLGLGDPFALKPAARPCSARAASAIAKPPPTELGARSGHPPSCKMTGTMRIPDRTMGGGARGKGKIRSAEGRRGSSPDAHAGERTFQNLPHRPPTSTTASRGFSALQGHARA